MVPLVVRAGSQYQQEHSEVEISIGGGGSRKGLDALRAGKADIADSDVDAGDPSLHENRVAAVAFAIVHGPNAGVASLTKAQIVAIFDGKVGNWKEVGGKDQPMVLFTRPRGSATRDVFDAVFTPGREPKAAGREVPSPKELVRDVARTPGAIGYSAIRYEGEFRGPIVAIGGATLTLAHIRDGSYPFWTFERMYTGAKSSPNAAAFIDAVRGGNGIIHTLGMLAMEDLAK